MMKSSGKGEGKLPGYEKGVSGNLLTVNHANSQQGKIPLFIFQEQIYIYINTNIVVYLWY